MRVRGRGEERGGRVRRRGRSGSIRLGPDCLQLHIMHDSERKGTATGNQHGEREGKEMKGQRDK